MTVISFGLDACCHPASPGRHMFHPTNPYLLVAPRSLCFRRLLAARPTPLPTPHSAFGPPPSAPRPPHSALRTPPYLHPSAPCSATYIGIIAPSACYVSLRAVDGWTPMRCCALTSLVLGIALVPISLVAIII